MKLRTKKTNKFRTKILASAISICLPYSLQAVNIDVTVGNDNGTGLVENTLSWAILQANTLPGNDIITLNTNVVINNVMKRIIDSNITIQSDNIRRTIDGGNSHIPLFIKSGNVIIQNLDIENGMARGGDSEQGGAGAGMGGSLFVYSGNVDVRNVNINNSQATAGQPNAGVTGYGGGGMFGYSTGFAGGGLFANGNNNSGGYGGYGNYQTPDIKFGTGGSYQSGTRHAGFGGGGACFTGSGGFGGGGGCGDYFSNGGQGGFGAGGGWPLDLGDNGVAGYGGNGQYSAGMGGAIFVRSGIVNLQNVEISQGYAYSTGGAKGLGGAIFVLHTITNSNGNNQGMPVNLATVSTCNVTFNNNTATSTDTNGNNTDNIFDLGDRIIDCNVFNDGFEN
jgi:hypothetical protein